MWGRGEERIVSLSIKQIRWEKETEKKWRKKKNKILRKLVPIEKRRRRGGTLFFSCHLLLFWYKMGEKVSLFILKERMLSAEKKTFSLKTLRHLFSSSSSSSTPTFERKGGRWNWILMLPPFLPAQTIQPPHLGKRTRRRRVGWSHPPPSPSTPNHPLLLVCSISQEKGGWVFFPLPLPLSQGLPTEFDCIIGALLPRAVALESAVAVNLADSERMLLLSG